MDKIDIVPISFWLWLWMFCALLLHQRNKVGGFWFVRCTSIEMGSKKWRIVRERTGMNHTLFKVWYCSLWIDEISLPVRPKQFQNEGNIPLFLEINSGDYVFFFFNIHPFSGHFGILFPEVLCYCKLSKDMLDCYQLVCLTPDCKSYPSLCETLIVFLRRKTELEDAPYCAS